MLENGEMERQMGRVHMSGQMATNTKAIGLTS